MFAWVIGLVAAWWVIAEGRPDGLPVAVGAAAVAGLVRRRLGPGPFRPIRPIGLLRFVPYFLWESLRGGVDVALRAIRPRLALSPHLIEHPVGLPGGPARTLFAGVLSLLPGTLTAELDGDRLTIHALTHDATLADRVRRLERLAGAVYGVVPADPDRP
jgi:multicomponent Na+:H+ antiporter subunit E